MFQRLDHREKSPNQYSVKRDFCVLVKFLAGRMWALNLETKLAQDFCNFVFVGHMTR